MVIIMIITMIIIMIIMANVMPIACASGADALRLPMGQRIVILP